MKRILIGMMGLLTVWTTVGRGETLRLERVEYPYPVQLFAFESQQQPLEMAYMDVEPNGDARGTVLLLHGKNFSGSYFAETIAAVRSAGFRVIVPDQIGFGKSTKPAHYQFSFSTIP